MGARKKFPSKECRRNFVLSFPYMQLDSLVELEGSPRAPLRLKENIGRAENKDEEPFHSASKIPMQLISGGNTLVTPNRHWKKTFPRRWSSWRSLSCTAPELFRGLFLEL
jgi:hypothetical protein